MVFCAVCFGDPSSPFTKGYNYAVIALLAVIVAVLISLAKFFLDFRKREKGLNKINS